MLRAAQNSSRAQRWGAAGTQTGHEQSAYRLSALVARAGVIRQMFQVNCNEFGRCILKDNMWLYVDYISYPVVSLSFLFD